MGDAAPCLVRSFSQPSSISCEFKEGDTLRALTTSISFGRFMTEPLDWEKWSAFSHNRTLEDVQKYSKPGSVAEKKAFFEAHYKKIATKKATKKSPKIENQTTKKSPNLVFSDIDEKTSTEDVSSPSTNLVLSNTGNVDEKTSTEDVLSPSTSMVLSDNVNVNDNTVSTRQVEQEKTSTEDVSLPSTSLVLSYIENMPSTHQVEWEKTSTEDVSLPSTSLVLPYIDDNMPSTRQVEREKTSTEDVPLPRTRRVEKGTQEREEKTRIKDKVSSRQTKPGISSRQNELRSPRKASKAAQSLHMSMNFGPIRKGKDMCSSLFANKKSVGKPKERLTQQAQTMASVNGVPKQVTGRTENRRAKTLLDCSVNGNKTVAVKSSLSAKGSESSSACTKKPRSTTTVSSSFSFRSEERATKRKEIFQKLEERGSNTKEAEKGQPQQKLKVKASNGHHNKLRRGTTLEAKPSTSETNSTQKVPTRPHSPKLGRKPTPRLVQDACYQPPWRSSTKPKNFVEINKKKLSSSIASLPTKKMHENASPNIQP